MAEEPPMKLTQRQQVLDLLRARGLKGVSAHEAVYSMGITRMAAIVFDLKAAGHRIETIDEGKAPDGRSKLARYVLKPKAPCGSCGHEGRLHPFGSCGVRDCACQGWTKIAVPA